MGHCERSAQEAANNELRVPEAGYRRLFEKNEITVRCHMNIQKESRVVEMMILMIGRGNEQEGKASFHNQDNAKDKLPGSVKSIHRCHCVIDVLLSLLPHVEDWTIFTTTEDVLMQTSLASLALCP